MEEVLQWIKTKEFSVALYFLGLLCATFMTLYMVEVTAEEAYICPKLEAPLEEEVTNEIVVDIKGAVVNPGIYRVSDSNIVNDIIVLAGGLRKDADTSNLNLSKKVSDEMVITVYTKEEVEQEKKLDSIVEEEQDSKNNNEIETKPGLVSLNHGTLEELMTLPGIAETKAKLIIQYRENCGSFKKKEDLLNIKGIGESVYAKLESYITL